MKNKLAVIILLIAFSGIAQSDMQNLLKGGEILINGLSFLKNKSDNSDISNSGTIANLCVRNKLTEKITFNLVGKDSEGAIVRKEMVIQKEGKECVFEIPKGIYTYEIVLANKEIFKKGEYKFNEEITITVKQE